MELYRPVRVNKHVKRYGLTPGSSLDSPRGWDFDRSCDRASALRIIDTQEPLLVIGSPMCTMFSTLQRFSRWNGKKQERWEEAVKHIESVVKVHLMQIEAGRYFLHEHPVGASSRGLKMMKGQVKNRVMYR